MPLFQPNMPVPGIDSDTQDFWEHCRRHELVVQRCSQCQSFRFAPAPICHQCHSSDYDNVVSDGIGEIFTWTITHRELHPAVKGSAPYNVIVVKLDDCGGAMLVSNLVGAANDSIVPGLKVKVEWEEINAEITLPRFRPLA